MRNKTELILKLIHAEFYISLICAFLIKALILYFLFLINYCIFPSNVWKMSMYRKRRSPEILIDNMWITGKMWKFKNRSGFQGNIAHWSVKNQLKKNERSLLRLFLLRNEMNVRTSLGRCWFWKRATCYYDNGRHPQARQQEDEMKNWTTTFWNNNNSAANDFIVCLLLRALNDDYRPHRRFLQNWLHIGVFRMLIVKSIFTFLKKKDSWIFRSRFRFSMNIEHGRYSENQTTRATLVQNSQANIVRKYFRNHSGICCFFSFDHKKNRS